jgi:hypothetical protein
MHGRPQTVILKPAELPTNSSDERFTAFLFAVTIRNEVFASRSDSSFSGQIRTCCAHRRTRK